MKIVNKFVVSIVGIKANKIGINEDACRLSMSSSIYAENKDEAIGKFLPKVLKEFSEEGYTFSVVCSIICD